MCDVIPQVILFVCILCVICYNFETEYSELITTGECGDRSEPGIFYDGNDLAWRNGVRLFKGYWALAGEVNFGCCLVM